MSELPLHDYNKQIDVQIVESIHILKLGEVHGLLAAAEALEKIAPEKQMPGFAFARALIDKIAAEKRALLISRNLATVAKAGVDISRIASVSALGTTLQCTPMQPGEEWE